MKKTQIYYQFVVLVMFFTTTEIKAQTIVSDSKGNEMFNFYTGGSVSFELESGKEEIEINYNAPIKKYIYYWMKEKDTTFTVATSINLQIGLSVFNSQGKINLAKLDEVKPGFELKLGLQKATDKIYGKAIQQIRNGSSAFGGYLYSRMDNVKYLDSKTLTISEIKPFSFGVKLNYANFKFYWFSFQCNANLGIRHNIDDLNDYFQNISIINSPQYFVPSNSADGKFGKPQKQKFVNISYANPFFLAFIANKLNRIAITPYGSLEYADKNNPLYRYGFMINYLGEAIDVENKEGYSISKGFGIGIDWTNNGKAFIFARGTLNIGEILKKNRNAISE